jgi:serine/threonine protein kinase
MYYDKRMKRLFLNKNKDILIEEENAIEINGKNFYLKNFNNNEEVFGGNSSLFILYDKEGIQEERVIKFSNFYKPNRNSSEKVKRRFGRFINEIDALTQIRSSDSQSNIVSLFDDGFYQIDDLSFPYYTMEKADDNLKLYLLRKGENVDFVERVKLIRAIFDGVRTLHEHDIYHRDIKPDNVLLFFNNNGQNNEEDITFSWKIGDLGLIAHRDKDYDKIGEKIGPIGWLSPEAMNKYLTEEYNVGKDCKIDESSDIFQLGKLFWFIFQYNAPIGQIKKEDFTYEMPNKDYIFDLIQRMLQYPKDRRPKKEAISEDLDLLAWDFGS